MEKRDRKLLTPRQAADEADVSLGLIYDWCATRVLPHFRIGKKGRRGRILIDPADLAAVLASRKVEALPFFGDDEFRHSRRVPS